MGIKDLLVSHDKLKLANEAIATKVISSEPHVDNGTTSTKMLKCHVLVHVILQLTLMLNHMLNYISCLVALIIDRKSVV